MSLVTIEIRFAWQDNGQVGLIGADLTFPDYPPAPGLYRYRFEGAGEPALYIGEALDLRRRAYGYRLGHPKQATNKRINDRMRAQLAAGGRVEVSMCTEVWYAAGGPPRPLDLTRKASRLLAENAAIHAVPDGTRLENLPGVGDGE